jgi:Skp family chaperone for outer membrane proteins
MIKPAILALLVLATPAFAEKERLKVGTVDMQRLFKGCHQAEIAQKECNIELAKLQKQDGDRLSRIREIDAELERLRKQLEDPTIAESKKDKLLQQASDRRQEGVALERERRDFVEGRRRSINERMVQQVKGLVDEIRKQLDEIAKTEDYDYVFDASGLSASQVPFVLTSRADDDLTEVVLTKLNAGAAKKEAEPVPK